MRDVLSAIMRSQRASPIPAPPPEPPRKKRYGRPALLLLGGAILGAAPFLFQTWSGKHSRKLTFEHALAIAVDPSTPADMTQTVWGRLMRLSKEGFAGVHSLKRRRPAFEPAVTAALNRLRALINNQKLPRKSRPNPLSYAEAQQRLSDPKSSQALVQTCLDLIAFDIEEAVRGLQVQREKGGKPGEAAIMILSWLRRFLEGG